MNETLYILMRSDMNSMTPGKACAQAAHAANHAAVNMSKMGAGVDGPGFVLWQAQTDQYFGTTIVLRVTSEQQLVDMVTEAVFFGYSGDIILDPTYPVRDGDVTHLIPVHTCGWIFVGDRTDLGTNVLGIKKLPLY